MKFACTIGRRSDGRWVIRHAGKDAGTVEVTAGSREEAVKKMEDELRYRLEMCPCTGAMYKNVQIELVEGG